MSEHAPSGKMVTVGQFAKAFGASRSTFLRWIDAGKLPEPWRAPADVVIPSGSDPPAGRSWRKWPVEVAAEALRKAGRPVPAEWEETPAHAGAL